MAVIGAGAAGMMCAAVAGQRGRSVVLIDHWGRAAEKIRISGGGRCNFTNTGTSPKNFVSADPAFCTTALAGYPPSEFLELVRRYRIGFHEKHRGQLFCDDSSESIIAMLRAECDRGGVVSRVPCQVKAVTSQNPGFRLTTDQGEIQVAKVVVATGGLSIPKIGASDFGYRVAKQFGMKVIEPRPALVPLTFEPAIWAPFALLAGVSLPVSIQTGPSARNTTSPSLARAQFNEDLLFTHRGLSGPAVLQISTYWEPHTALSIDLFPKCALTSMLREAKSSTRSDLGRVLTNGLPKRLIQTWVSTQIPDGAGLIDRKIAEISNKTLDLVAKSLNGWQIEPSSTEGFKKAEVTRGGIDTRGLSPATLEAASQPGLYFIGEVVDVTGWLGGYNFQWAWASGVAAGRAI